MAFFIIIFQKITKVAKKVTKILFFFGGGGGGLFIYPPPKYWPENVKEIQKTAFVWVDYAVL